ncbi:MAG: hypothetical protein DMG65_15250 [Candidatus Angelobacter sp. Gp1-AA117]|nr:MAG: hypothetical protein DMG65_15250 [Candidatus Angelobacter sp. Gp1-AA117]
MQPDYLPARMFLRSFAASLFVVVVSLIMQWVVYDDWLHRSGLRIVGTCIAAIVTFFFTLRWQYAVLVNERRMVRQFEMISHMNDRIRNALQAIECVTYVSAPTATGAVRREVDAIDRVLREVLERTEPAARPAPAAKNRPTAASQKSA